MECDANQKATFPAGMFGEAPIPTTPTSLCLYTLLTWKTIAQKRFPTCFCHRDGGSCWPVTTRTSGSTSDSAPNSRRPYAGPSTFDPQKTHLPTPPYRACPARFTKSARRAARLTTDSRAREASPTVEARFVRKPFPSRHRSAIAIQRLRRQAALRISTIGKCVAPSWCVTTSRRAQPGLPRMRVCGAAVVLCRSIDL